MKLNDEPLPFQVGEITYRVNIMTGEYPNGRLALELVCAETIEDMNGTCPEGTNILTATTNLPDDSLSPFCVFIKGYSENKGVVAWLVKNGIILPDPVDKVVAGHTVIRSYLLPEPIIEKVAHCPFDDCTRQEYRVILDVRKDRPTPDAGQIMAGLPVDLDGIEHVDVLHVGEHAEGVKSYPLDEAELATVLAALRLWQREGMGEPANRPEDLHDIAAPDHVMSSLDDAGIDALCERLNTGG